ncbi:glycosyltransferase family 4 protein [Scandinavium lactucae]|uniref:Glycosyltransferase family 4 protein n=1 Tax=Scandinavium lactucae TaxID=3095028 RepID=A0ABU4QPD9_9ENTR|nr:MULTISPECIES: glycosyltransferase family 4 protein [unclassified Scandinavium]MDX6040103.1 glycosyltransferase family 4 protein [Scandinavium sp. V105_6]MDX6050906.1 glycosyltransferase family 4 protein [Scandinavium sp. V105_1]
MLKIVISANTSWYIYNFRKNTIVKLLEEGHSVFIVSPADAYTEKLKELGCGFFNVNISQRGMNPFTEAKTLIEYHVIYRKIRPSHILNFTPKSNIYSTFAAYLSSATIINNIAGLGTAFIERSKTKSIIKILYKISQRRAKIVFFQNNDDLTQFVNDGIVHKEQTRLIPGSGVDLSRFQLNNRKTDGITKYILIARLIKEKGIAEFAQAAKILKDKYGDKVHFSLAGFVDQDNPSAVPLELINKWHDDGVMRFLGKTDKVEDLLQNNDCVVLPSYYREGVPKSLLEAAAMGKIIVTTDNVGCREAVIDNETGYLCEPRSVLSLTCALEKVILMDHKAREEMGRAGRDYISRRFDEQIVINEYLSCL